MLTKEYLEISKWSDQYNCCWYQGSLWRQIIFAFARLVYFCPSWKRISTMCTSWCLGMLVNGECLFPWFLTYSAHEWDETTYPSLNSNSTAAPMKFGNGSIPSPPPPPPPLKIKSLLATLLYAGAFPQYPCIPPLLPTKWYTDQNIYFAKTP